LKRLELAKPFGFKEEEGIKKTLSIFFVKCNPMEVLISRKKLH